MPTLYTISLSLPRRGHVKGPVRAIRAIYAGHYREEEGDIMAPDMDAVRECLPHYYRVAFDRAGKPWFPSRSPSRCDGPAYISLYNRRGRYINTIYMQPYSFVG